MQKLKVGDKVQVIAGKDKGRTGKVLEIDREKRKVLVEKINIAKKRLKPNVSKDMPSGGIKEIEMPFDISNVMVVCPSTNQPTRVRIDVDKDGNKKRFSVKGNVVIDG